MSGAPGGGGGREGEGGCRRSCRGEEAYEDERRAAAAEAERQAKAAEADRKAQDAQQKAEQAERDRAAAAAAAAKPPRRSRHEKPRPRARWPTRRAKEATCKDEQGKLDAILTKGSDGTGVDDLKAFSKTVTCDRLGPVVVAAIDRFNAEAAKRAAIEPNSQQLVTSAQTELVRLGCLTGKADGKLSDPTKAAFIRYFAIGGQPVEADRISVTQDLVGELAKHSTRVCPIQCKGDETLKGDVCVANERSVARCDSIAQERRRGQVTPQAIEPRGRSRTGPACQARALMRRVRDSKPLHVRAS